MLVTEMLVTVWRAVGVALVVVHVVLGGWAVAGLVEQVAPNPPWPPLSNPALPPALLVVHWSLMLVTAAVFVAGFVLRWPRTPVATAAAYAALAVLCAIETVGFLREPRWYASMAVEYTAYAVILLLLFRTPVRMRFTHRARPVMTDI